MSDKDVADNPSPTVGLAIIAKNEATTLPHLLDSVKGAFDEIALLDTGSSDGTLETFIGWCTEHKQPRHYSQQVWHPFDFAAARNFAQAMLTTDWIVWADCDDEIEGAKRLGVIADLAHFTADAFRFRYDIARDASGSSTCMTWRERLVRRGKGRWVGAVHECQVIDSLELGFRMWDNEDVVWHHHPERKPAGAKPSRTPEREITALAPDALENTRSMFYLAQACRDGGRLGAAAELYEYRADMEGGWDEEVYVALWQAGLAWSQLDRWDRAMDCLTRAMEVKPQRAEATYELVAGLRNRGRHRTAYALAQGAMYRTPPADALFAAPWVYEWGVLFEASICAFYADEKAVGREYCRQLLDIESLPAQYRERTIANLALYDGLDPVAAVMPAMPELATEAEGVPAFVSCPLALYDGLDPLSTVMPAMPATYDARPAATVIVPVYNAFDVAVPCVQSVLRSRRPDDEVIVVDNGSSPAFTPMPYACNGRLLRIDVNKGFASACNLAAGLERASTAAHQPIFVFLNSDTVVGPEWLDLLLAPFADETVGAVGPRGNNVSGAQGLAGFFDDVPGPGFSSRVQHRDVTYQVTRRLVGFCLAVRRIAFEGIGGWDESFGLGYEDDDLCRRLTDAGWKLLITNDCFVYHHGHASFTASGLDWYAEQQKARVRYVEKWA